MQANKENNHNACVLARHASKLMLIPTRAACLCELERLTRRAEALRTGALRPSQVYCELQDTAEMRAEMVLQCEDEAHALRLHIAGHDWDQ